MTANKASFECADLSFRVKVDLDDFCLMLGFIAWEFKIKFKSSLQKSNVTRRPIANLSLHTSP
jgi:hypothetical protein